MVKADSILDASVLKADWFICLWRRAAGACGRTLAFLGSLPFRPHRLVVLVTLCVSISYLDSGLLGGDVALHLAEFLFKPCHPRLNRLLLGDCRSQKRLQQVLIGNVGFLGVSLLCAKIGCVEINDDGHPTFLSNRIANEFCAFSVDLQMVKVWLSFARSHSNSTDWTIPHQLIAY